MSLGNVQIHTLLQQKLPCILADGNQLQQVFLNLIVNALEAMPGGGELRVETAVEEVNRCFPGRSGDRPTRCVAVHIRDTGQGIPEAHLDKIFDPFFTTKGAAQGTGIGLAVCAQIIQAHGGSITAHSQEGEGSTFTVRFPIPEGE
jgi:signal transduction histidine kinase